MSVTIDCGEGKHDLCIGWGKQNYLIPQTAGMRFDCACSCHKSKQLSSVPDCPYCKTPMVRMTTQAGRGLFSCRRRECQGSREYYHRDGSPH